MNQKICDLCKSVISQVDRTYFVSYGEVSKFNLMGGGNIKKGEICYACCKKVEKSVEDLKVR